MATLLDIKPSICDIPEAERLPIIAEMSRNRHIPLKSIAKAKATVEKKAKSRTTKLDKLTEGMSKEQLEALIKEFGEG